jgi:hypothetical protein
VPRLTTTRYALATRAVSCTASVASRARYTHAVEGFSCAMVDARALYYIYKCVLLNRSSIAAAVAALTAESRQSVCAYIVVIAEA